MIAFVDHPQMRREDLAIYLSETFTSSRILAELCDPKATFLIAEIEGESAGYAKLIDGAWEPGVKASKPVKLQRLYSRQKFIGRGLGATLVSRCLEEAAAREK